MPSGSFNETCRNCSLDYHVLVCTCLMQVDPLVSLHSRPNLTGEWTSGGNFSSVGDTFLFSLRSLHKIKMINVTDNSIAYQVTCFDGGQNRQKTCSPNLITKDGEYHPWEYWQSANITVRPGNTTMRLDNGSVLYGTIATDFNSVKWTYRNTSSSSGSDLPDPVVWVRRKFEKTGIRTSMSLKSCERVPMPSGSLGFNVTNENGYLTCDWTNKPPPRVGPYLHSLRGRWAIKRNCKTIASCEWLRSKDMVNGFGSRRRSKELSRPIANFSFQPRIFVCIVIISPQTTGPVCFRYFLCSSVQESRRSYSNVLTRIHEWRASAKESLLPAVPQPEGLGLYSLRRLDHH